jgi:hypothetical protein
MESMQDHKQHRDDKSTNQLDIVLNIHRIPTNITCRLHNDDLDHDRKLRRSKLEAHGGEDIHLATAMDP